MFITAKHTTVAAAALTAGFLAFAAPAAAAPTGTGDAEDTISSLHEQGYHVIVNRLSNTPLAEASVVSIGRGANFSHTVSGANNDVDKVFGPVTKMTVYVNVR